MSNAHTVERPRVGVRELKQNASRVIADVQAENRGRIITVHGRPAAALVPLGQVVLDQPEHQLRRMGVPRGELLGELSAFPVAPFSAAAVASWADDIRAAYGDGNGDNVGDGAVDPFERAGQ